MQDMEGDILEKEKPSAPVKDSEGRRIDEDVEPYAAGLVPFGDVLEEAQRCRIGDGRFETENLGPVEAMDDGEGLAMKGVAYLLYE